MLHVCCRMLRGEQEEHNPLSEEECSKLQMVVDAYVNNPSTESTLPISGDMRMIRCVQGHEVHPNMHAVFPNSCGA